MCMYGGPSCYIAMASTSRGWSCSTLMAGVKAISGQDTFLKSTSDGDLERELAATYFRFSKFCYRCNMVRPSMYESRVKLFFPIVRIHFQTVRQHVL